MITKNSTLSELNALNKNTLMDNLGMEYLEVSEGYVKARMPVDHRTLQPFGILHGGASLALAETVASLGSALLVDLNQFDIRGAMVAANHIGSIGRGFVTGEAHLLHKGKLTHVWDVEITGENGYKVSAVRITMVVVSKNQAG